MCLRAGDCRAEKRFLVVCLLVDADDDTEEEGDDELVVVEIGRGQDWTDSPSQVCER